MLVYEHRYTGCPAMSGARGWLANALGFTPKQPRFNSWIDWMRVTVLWCFDSTLEYL